MVGFLRIGGASIVALTASPMIRIDPLVLSWMREPPYQIPDLVKANPEFDYRGWIERGKALTRPTDSLLQVLQEQDVEAPTVDAMRAIVALDYVGDKRAQVTTDLLRIFKADDLTIKSRVAQALGSQGDPRAGPFLEKLLTDRTVDQNIRANAAISLGRLAPAHALETLRSMQHDEDEFVRGCVAIGLEKLSRRR